MRTLTIGFFAEGTTDYRFLSIIIQRTAERILCNNHCGDVSVLMPIPIEKVDGVTSEEKILNAATRAYGVDLLIIHMDADNRTLDQTKEERFIPGQRLVTASPGSACQELIPIIPVKNIESWMLCDHDAFQRTVGTRLSANDLGLPIHPHQVESIRDPKHSYQNAVRIALTERRKRGKINCGLYYEPLGRNIELNRLESISAYVAFKRDLENYLVQSNFIPHQFQKQFG